MKGKTVLTVLFVIIGFLVLVEVLALVKLVYSVGSYKKYWNEQNTAVAVSTERQYIALGDSAAQGVGASRPQKGYVGLLARHLQTNNVVNLSVSGARVADVTAKQVPMLEQYTPEQAVITLAIGGNDMKNFEADRFRSEMDELLSRLPKHAVVADVPYFGGGRFRSLENNVIQANKIVRELARAHGMRLAPLYDITKQRDSVLVYAPDYFHPSNTGYKNWYEAFRTVITN